MSTFPDAEQLASIDRRIGEAISEMDEIKSTLEDDIAEAPAALDDLFQGATAGQPDVQKAAETMEAESIEIPAPQAVSVRSA